MCTDLDTFTVEKVWPWAQRLWAPVTRRRAEPRGQVGRGEDGRAQICPPRFSVEI